MQPEVVNDDKRSRNAYAQLRAKAAIHDVTARGRNDPCCLCQTELKSDKKKRKLHNQACRLEKLRSTVEGLEKRLHDLSKNLHIVGPVRGEDCGAQTKTV